MSSSDDVSPDLLVAPEANLANGVLTGAQVKKLFTDRAASCGLTYEQAAAAIAEGRLPDGPAGVELAELGQCIGLHAR